MTTEHEDQRAHGAADDPAPRDTGAAAWQARLDALRQLVDVEPLAARQQVAAAIDEARAQQRLDVQSQLAYLAGMTELRLDHAVEAAVHLHGAIGLARALGRADLEANHLAGLGVALSRLCDFSAAIACYEGALSLQEGLPASAGTDRVRARVLNNLGLTFCFMGLPHKALPLFYQARDLFLRLGEAFPAAVCLVNCAEAEVDRAERLGRQSVAQGADEGRQAALAACDLAAQVLVDPAVPAGDINGINAQLITVRAQTVLGDWADALERLTAVDQQLIRAAHRLWFRTDRRVLRARLLRLTGRAGAAVDELRGELAEAIAAADRARVIKELVAAQEAAGDAAGALASFRQYHELTLQARDQVAEQRGQVLNARLELERVQHRAEIERLRAEQLTLHNEELARQVQIDALTGLPNRRGLDAALAQRAADARSRFACVLADLDHFKQINDRYSHAVGDAVLRRVGALMREAVRDGDVAARYGGEEFALLLDRVEERQAVEVCERLRAAIAAQPWEQMAAGLVVTISIGVAVRRPGDSGEALLARADECLYAAKAAGRDRVVSDGAGPPAPVGSG